MILIIINIKWNNGPLCSLFIFLQPLCQWQEILVVIAWLNLFLNELCLSVVERAVNIIKKNFQKLCLEDQDILGNIFYIQCVFKKGGMRFVKIFYCVLMCHFYIAHLVFSNKNWEVFRVKITWKFNK